MRRITLPLFLFPFIAATAQPKTDKASIEWGPELSSKESGTFSALFGQSDDAVYMSMYKKRDLMVQKMDNTLSSRYSKLLDLEMDKDDLGLEDMMVLGDRILVFASFYNKKEDNRTMYLRTFDEATMAPQGGWEQIARFDSEKASQGGFGLELSPDEKHVLVFINLPYEKDAPEKFKLHVFNAAMEAEWDREITLPYSDKEFSFEEFRVGNDGDVIMIGVKYAEKREAKALKRADKAHYDYHLLTYSADGSDDDHTIAVKDKFLQDLTLSLPDGPGPILCGGFYGDKGVNKVRGSFFLRLNPATKAVEHESFKEFADDFITQYMTAKQEEKARKKAEKKDEDLQMYEYDLDEIVRREDGGAVLVGEQYYMYVTTYTTSGPNGQQYTRTVYHYIYNSIIVINIDPEGNIEWASQIPKLQHTTNDGGFFSSYALEVKGENLYFIYNDNGKNLFLNAGDKFESTDFQGKSSIVTIATVNADGHVTREALFDPEKRELILRPKSCRQLQDDRMFLFSTRKDDYRFGMVTFD